MSTLKAHGKWKLIGYEKLPSIFKTLGQLTRDFWHFSFHYGIYGATELMVSDVEKQNAVLHNEVMAVNDALKNLEADMEAIESQLSDELGNNPKNKM